MEGEREHLADTSDDKLDKCEESTNHCTGTMTHNQDGSQTRSLTIAPASSQDVSLLTTAILELTMDIQSYNPLVEDSKQNKGNEPRVHPKKGKHIASTTKVAKMAQNIPSTVKKEPGGENSTSSINKTDCQGLYDAVLNDECEFVKEYETDDTVGKGLNNGQLAKLVNEMFRSQLGEKADETNWTTRSELTIVKMLNRLDLTVESGVN